MTEVDWNARVGRLADEDLVEIVSTGDSGGFEAVAVQAATVELNRRGIAPQFVADVETAVQDRHASRRARATEPLSNAGWVAFILFGPILMVTLAIVIIFVAMGQTQKAKDALITILWSFLLWAALGWGLLFLLGWPG